MTRKRTSRVIQTIQRKQQSQKSELIVVIHRETS
jgi:hypothetical protein